jgi:hypothetical protein
MKGLVSGSDGVAVRDWALAAVPQTSSASTPMGTSGRRRARNNRVVIVKCTRGKTSNAGLRAKKILQYLITIQAATSVSAAGTKS